VNRDSKIDVRYVAKLARLALTSDEAQTFGAQLGLILEHAAVLEKLPTADVPATAQVIEARNVERDDISSECLPRETVLAGAPATQGPFVRVPRIIAEE
jgi:aspartyl-tRNA(Asn)/glutamyl-tRNA(Gln) amidotransferase subunit C